MLTSLSPSTDVFVDAAVHGFILAVADSAWCQQRAILWTCKVWRAPHTCPRWVCSHPCSGKRLDCQPKA